MNGRRHIGHERPLIAVTMGDPTGVGPEIILKSFLSRSFQRECQAFIVGRPVILRAAATACGMDLLVQEVDSVDEVLQALAANEDRPTDCQTIVCLAASDESVDEATSPCIDPRGGKLAYDCLLAAARLAMDGEVDAIVTSPLHKVALKMAGHDWPGHTELLAHFCGAKESAMMLYLPPGKPRHGGIAGLGVVHVTLHIALRDVFKNLSRSAILEKIQLAHDFFSRMRVVLGDSTPPRIAVAALNPHGGEGGRFGDEETMIIAPAVEHAIERGIDAIGPLPVDTLMPKAADGDYDAVVAMYHDQGHIALKLLDMFEAVNVTLGLPIIRTSVAHGTGHDIAWRNQAKHGGMTQAILAAARLSCGAKSRS